MLSLVTQKYTTMKNTQLYTAKNVSLTSQTSIYDNILQEKPKRSVSNMSFSDHARFYVLPAHLTLCATLLYTSLKKFSSIIQRFIRYIYPAYICLFMICCMSTMMLHHHNICTNFQNYLSLRHGGIAAFLTTMATIQIHLLIRICVMHYSKSSNFYEHLLEYLIQKKLYWILFQALTSTIFFCAGLIWYNQPKICTR